MRIFARAALVSTMLAGIAAAQSPTNGDTSRVAAIPTHQLRTKEGSTVFGRLVEDGRALFQGFAGEVIELPVFLVEVQIHDFYRY